LCISIPAVLGPIVYKYQLNRDALDVASNALKKAQLEMQHTYRFTRDFTKFEARDAEFFETGSSEYLNKGANSLGKSRSALAELRSFANADLNQIVDQIIAMLDHYDATVNRLVDLLRERGYQDYGVVGTMRSAIHDLERDVDAPELLVHMLSLRRLEKDYIIRSELRYVDALTERAGTFESEIHAYTPLSREERNRLKQKLHDYVAAFRKLVSVDEIIGIHGGAGLFGELTATEDSLTVNFNRLQSALDEVADAETHSLARYLQVSIGAVVALSTILSLLLFRKLMGPLNVLSGKIQLYVESKFTRDADLEDLASKNDEVGQLARDFVSLQEAIKEYVSSIRNMAYYDMLTGAASRAYLNQRLNEMIGAAPRRGEGFSLFFVDLDAFKDVNDSLGHDAGDQLLVEVANRLTDAARRSDFVARLGGDEFCLLLEGLSDEADIVVVAERCISNIEMPVTINGKTFRPQASIGISRFPSDGTDAKELMQAGDNAMYAAKVAGHHRFEFFRKEMTQRAADRLTIAQELRAAFRNKEFLLYYQPQVDVRSGKISGWEALARWQHPKRGMVLPNDFIPEIERLGLINELGNWVIREACRQLATWKAQGLEDMRVSVNVAPRQLSDKNLFCSVSQALSDADIDPNRFELEVTESGIQSTPDGREVLNKLKSLGVRVAIDDFGTGYSSLGSLKHLPIDCLKIDRSFIRDMVHDSQDAVVLGTIMALGRALQFDIVAEGVEDIEQMQILQGLGCDLVQGYLFSKPIPPVDVPELAGRNFLDHQPDANPANTQTKLAS
jgi:diguanylate cyclase (GGDEF)-like protein